jgi:hypothetical protein
VDEGVDPDAARKREGPSSLGALRRAGTGAWARKGTRRRRKEDRGGMVREKRGLRSSFPGKGGGGGRG